MDVGNGVAVDCIDEYNRGYGPITGKILMMISWNLLFALFFQELAR